MSKFVRAVRRSLPALLGNLWQTGPHWRKLTTGNRSTKCGSLCAACARRWRSSTASCHATSSRSSGRRPSGSLPLSRRHGIGFREVVEDGPLTHYAQKGESFEALLTTVEGRRLAAYAIA